MSFLDSFNNFYDNLSETGVLFFWIVVFLLVFLLSLSVVLIVKNKKLTKAIIEEQNNIKEKETKIEEMTISLKKQEEKQEIPLEVEPQKKPNAEEKQQKQEISSSSGPYQKNILREMNARMQTSPIHIEKEAKNSSDFDLSALNPHDESTSPLEEMEDIYEAKSETMSFAEDISRKLEEEVKPSNIELTAYEKKEEEEAIISYGELQKVKDKIYNITEDEETDDFIDELKNFRLDLQ